eukprot:142566_1
MGESKGNERTLCISASPLILGIWISAFIPLLLSIPVHYFGFQQSLKLKPTMLQIVYWITSVSLCIAGISFPMNQTFDLTFSGYCDDFTRIVITNSMVAGFYTFSLVCINCLYLLRMHLSFKNSSYALSTCTISILIFGLIVECFLVIACVYCNYLTWWAVAMNQRKNLLVYTYIFWLFWSSFAAYTMTYNVILLLLFWYKLHQMSKYAVSIARNIVEPAVVYSLCLCITFVTTLTSYGLGWCRGNVMVDNNDIYMVHLTVIGCDIFFNTLCINLQFNAAQSIFNKLCGKCKQSLLKRYMNAMTNDRTLALTAMTATKRQVATHSTKSSAVTGNTTTSTYGVEAKAISRTISSFVAGNDGRQRMSEYHRVLLIEYFIRRYANAFVPSTVRILILKIFGNTVQHNDN